MLQMSKPAGESQNLAETIFFAARQLAGAPDRAKYLENACGGDPALRERVERMLEAERKADQFLAGNPLELDESPPTLADLSGKEGSVIGCYKLLQQIGEGGCGVVYMAGQEVPIRRRVALKLIKPGMDTRQVIARFEAERQALAMMDHPNIARVLDAGATDAGRPYFVMELVRGIPLTGYCDQNNLGTRERLALFIKVVQAVQHAHQKGIIHRDLKPSNVLVTLHDGVPVPKVIDFGIAKAMEQKLTDKTLFTQFEQFIGTPAYTSPEQAEMSGLDIDTRSDIYSLGVLLYELLVGGTPFDSRDLLKSGLNEMRRIIREKEPERPSARLSTMLAQERTATAQRRAASAPDLIHLLKGDLDWIAMKCLEKDRTRRYDTASALAADIQNYLSSQPVSARPPSASYKLSKLVRRNKLAVAAGSAVAMALVIGILASAWQANRARRAEQSAIAEKESAQAVLNFFREKVLAAARPEGMDGGLGREVTLRQAIDSAEPQIAESFKDRPAVEAAIRFTIGDSYSLLGDSPSAVKQLERSVALYRQSLGLEHPDTLAAMEKLALFHLRGGSADLALTLSEELFAVRKAKLGPEHADTLASLGVLAASYRSVGKLDQALAAAEERYRIEKKNIPDSMDYALLGLARVYRDQGRLEEAVPLFEKGIEQLRRKDPSNFDILVNLDNLAVVHAMLGQNDRSVPLFEEARGLSKAKLGPAHPDALRPVNHMVAALMGEGEFQKAEDLLARVLSEVSGHSGGTAMALERRAWYYTRRERLSEALADYSEAIRLAPQASRYRLRGDIYARTERWRDAIDDYRKAIEMEPSNHLYYHHLAACLVQTQALGAYRENCRQIIARFRESDDPIVMERMAKDCSILPDSGVDLAVLNRWTEQAVAAGESHWAFPWFCSTKGLVQFRHGRYADAADSMERLLQRWGDSPDSERAVQGWMVLAMARHKLREYEAAVSALAKGLELAETALAKPGSGDVGVGWMDWGFVQALIHEARTLIEQGSK